MNTQITKNNNENKKNNSYIKFNFIFINLAEILLAAFSAYIAINFFISYFFYSTQNYTILFELKKISPYFYAFIASLIMSLIFIWAFFQIFITFKDLKHLKTNGYVNINVAYQSNFLNKIDKKNKKVNILSRVSVFYKFVFFLIALVNAAFFYIDKQSSLALIILLFTAILEFDLLTISFLEFRYNKYSPAYSRKDFKYDIWNCLNLGENNYEKK